MWWLSYDIISNAIGITDGKRNCLALSVVFFMLKRVYWFIGL